MILKSEALERIKKEIESEFPNDFALQQIHFVRKIISKGAKKKAMSYTDHVKQDLMAVGKTDLKQNISFLE